MNISQWIGAGMLIAFFTGLFIVIALAESLGGAFLVYAISGAMVVFLTFATKLAAGD